MWACPLATSGLLTAVASVWDHGLQVPQLQWVSPSGSVVAHRLGRPVVLESSPDQGLNLCPLHWQADSSPLDHRANPGTPLPTSFSVARLSARRCCQADNSERALKDPGGQGLPATRTDGAVGSGGQALGKRPDRRLQKDCLCSGGGCVFTSMA